MEGGKGREREGEGEGMKREGKDEGRRDRQKGRERVRGRLGCGWVTLTQSILQWRCCVVSTRLDIPSRNHACTAESKTHIQILL